MKAREIRNLNAEDVAKQLEEARKELFELRFRMATRQLVNHREIRAVKKTIARLMTIMKERELGIR
ncbi:MAG: 50S ribosomal protein L29 [Dehalococcoidales bacterium]|jgi:large subunit ribosomal protein L29|nr:50S ribosomal protein L29 [Dehalococcoidales bacterium]MDP7286177.1 50S ribosomal protein L29 [Dehalococcoidales bacterium]MDP7524990.1 50S ribosomal protein L29 [Dehalococcoidales bacterium]